LVPAVTCPSLAFRPVDLPPSNVGDERAVSAGHQLDRGGSCLRIHDAVDDPFAVAAVLFSVGSVDLVVEGGVGVGEGDVLVDAAGPDVALVAHLGAGEPAAGTPVHGADIEVVAHADDPDGPRVAQGAVASAGGDL
jgi:hypothetical protein